MGHKGMSPKVSVIIPAYNAEKTLKRCLDSVFAQDFDAFEVILVNDGSTDGTFEIALQYQDHPNFALIDQPNGGVAKARWSGVEVSKGEYIGFVDADDMIDKRMFPLMHERATVSGADIAVCNWYTVGTDTVRHDLYMDISSDSVEENVCRVIFENRDGHMVNKVFRRELLSEDYFRKTFGKKFCEDLLLMVYLIPLAKRVTYLSDPLYYRLSHSGSATGSHSLGSLRDFLSVHEEILQYFLMQENELFRRKAPGLFAKGLLDLCVVLGSGQSGNEPSNELRQAVKKRVSAFPLMDLFKSRPDFRTLLLFLLCRYRIYGFVHGLWISRFFKPVRFIKRHFLGKTKVVEKPSLPNDPLE